jgi:hypothetical protein
MICNTDSTTTARYTHLTRKTDRLAGDVINHLMDGLLC